jgi:hypothetical protein
MLGPLYKEVRGLQVGAGWSAWPTAILPNAAGIVQSGKPLEKARGDPARRFGTHSSDRLNEIRGLSV